MSAWTQLVTKTYKKYHKKNSTYKLKDAMKDAAKIYKMEGGASSGKTQKIRKTSRKMNK